MSRIDRLSIQGIRNFAPEQAEIIAFEPPVTLILGRNGSGKTTIIESLKYATTGEMPAGTNRGQSFIHDPKLTSRQMSIGSVKLQFYDEQGTKYIVARSMEARLLKSKMEFKTTDTTITTFDSNDKAKSLKNKNNDVNPLICNMLGVSKALLNNVLFCHQEDSNWPLDEAKKVKDKFDDIFNTTRYVKCQDEIRKQINEIKSRMKDIERNIDHYKMLKENAECHRSDIRKHTERKKKLELEMEDFDREKKSTEDELSRFKEQHQKAVEFKHAIEIHKQQLDRLEHSQVQLQSNTTHRVSGNAEELKEKIQQFQTTISERRDLLSSQMMAYEECKGKQKILISKQQEASLAKGKLQSELEHHKKLSAERDDLLIDLACRHQWPSFEKLKLGDTLSSSQVIDFRRLLTEIVASCQNDEMSTKDRQESMEQELLEDLTRCREQCARMEQDKKSKEDTLHRSRNELANLNDKLKVMEESSQQVSSLEAELATALSVFQRTEQNINTQRILDEIAIAKTKRSELQIESDQLDQMLKQMASKNEIRFRLDHAQKELAVKKQLERRLMSRPNVVNAMQLLLDGEKDSINLLADFNARLDSITTKLRQEQQKMTDLGKEVATIEADIRNKRRQLESKKSELIEYQKQLSEVGVGSAKELNREIERLERDLVGLEDQNSLMIGSEKTILHYIEKMEKHHSNACPLCHREFQEIEETQELIKELKTSVEQIPIKLSDLKKRIYEKKEKKTKLLQLCSVAKMAGKLQEEEVPHIQSELHDLENKLASNKNHLRQLEDTIEFLQSEVDVGTNSQQEVGQIEAARNDIDKLTIQVGNIKKQLSGSNVDASLVFEDLQAKYEATKSRLQRTQSDIENRMEEHSLQQKLLTDLKQNINRLTEQKLRLTDSLQQRASLLDRCLAVEGNLKLLERDIKACGLDLQPLIERRDLVHTTLMNDQKRHKQELEHTRTKVLELQQQQRLVDQLGKLIQDWSTLGKDKQLECSIDLVDNLRAKQESLEHEVDQRSRDISDLTLKLNNIENEEHNLRNNLELVLNQQKIVNVKKEIDQLKILYCGFDITLLEREIRDRMECLSRGNITMGEKRGTLTEIIKIIEELEQKLMRKDLVQAEEQYFKQVQEYEVHYALSEDLQNFYKGLEWALMKFHKERMGVINNLIRGMWSTTYKGRDIDFIEIKAEETSSIGGNSRRQYNYRVVMSKNGHEMDMRGRCSAGQKVLASLIIRMALAEAFSSKCGVLALDEPTTNLDEENIASLSDTILELSNHLTRQKRKFQLIIITHDEKFLERMSRDKRMEKYYRVDRNRNNVSEITEWDVASGRSGREMFKNK